METYPRLVFLHFRFLVRFVHVGEVFNVGEAADPERMFGVQNMAVQGL